MEAKEEVKKLKLNPSVKKQPEPITYDKLKEICSEQHMQIQRMKEELMYLRQNQDGMQMGFLLKIIELRDAFDKDFIEEVITGVTNLFSPSKEDDVKEDNVD